jgi:predicted N-acetyltransferase YhbS
MPRSPSPHHETIIRPAAPADAAALAGTIVAAFEQYRGRLAPESAALGMTAAGVTSELQQGVGAFLAERNGAIVGCVMTKTIERDLYFGRLSVLPNARGFGVARRLVSAVEDDARRRGLPATRLNVRIALPQNQKFFASLGYAETRREAHPGFDQPTFINMRKVLRTLQT